ncbi:MAG: DNA primase [Chitinophagia bacterium]|nr:DNA primase [Chitinophagia bacterium]
MIKANSIKEVMDRADIIDIVGSFLRVKKRGANYIGNCPFHNEKTPSFYVSPSKGIFKCFGCGKAGNVVTFVQEHEKLTYPEAIKWLADYYKIKLEETDRLPEQIAQQQAGETLRIINEYAANFYQDTLFKQEEGQMIGMAYLKQRGLRENIIQLFRLGYAPLQADYFCKAAIAKGYNAGILLKAGLVKERQGGIFNDNYRERIIFPIQSLSGRVVGFGARVIKNTDHAPKYINTPENELYQKSKILYGLYQSRNAIGKLDECLLVEGYMDVISLHQAGVQNVVASSGTSLTEDQLRLIARLTKNLVILYDGDNAGIKAALRGLDMALSQSFNVQLVLLPKGEDPDSFVQKNGSDAFYQYVKENKEDVIGFRMRIGVAEVGNDPVKKSKLVNEIAETISLVNKAEDFSLQAHYIKKASALLDVEEAGLVQLINQIIRNRVDKERKSPQAAPLPPSETPTIDPPALPQSPLKSEYEYEWQLLRVLAEYGSEMYNDTQTVASFIHAEVEPEFIKDTLVKELYTHYVEKLVTENTFLDVAYYLQHSNPAVATKMASLLIARQEISPNWSKKYGIDSTPASIISKNDVDSTYTYYQLKKTIALQKETLEKLKTITDPVVITKMMAYFQELRALEKELAQKHETVVYKSNRY